MSASRPGKAKPNANRKPGGTLRPGDDYDLRGDIEQDLLHHGWEVERRAGSGCIPAQAGKRQGASGNSYMRLQRMSSGAFRHRRHPLKLTSPIRRFRFTRLLEHNGDFTAAAKALAQLGYGTPKATGKATQQESGNRDRRGQAETD